MQHCSHHLTAMQQPNLLKMWACDEAAASHTIEVAYWYPAQVSLANVALDALAAASGRRGAPRFAEFMTTLPPNKYFRGRAGGRVYYNTVVVLPLSLADVRARLQSGYYRSLKALQHDMHTIANNAAVYNGSVSDRHALRYIHIMRTQYLSH